jgi:hypothetical protein
MSLYNYLFPITDRCKLSDIPMRHHDELNVQSPSNEPNPADSRADAIAAFFAIAIAVSGVLYFISQQ